MSEKLHYLISALVPQYTEYSVEAECAPGKYFRFCAYPPHSLCELFSEAAQRAALENQPVHFLHSPLDDTLQGVFLPAQKAALVQENLFLSADRNFTELYASVHAKRVRACLEAASSVFHAARTFHNLEEEIYVQHMDFDKANELSAAYADRLLSGRKKAESRGKAFHRFFGAAGINGNICYIPQLTEEIGKRYFIKGRPGTGKSTFLKKIANALSDCGIDTEIYHCSLDPNSLDMVIAREIGVCLFDSTAPHVFFPVREDDEIIDLYQLCVTPGTDEKYAGRILELETAYKERIREGLRHLNEMYQARDSFFGALPPMEQKAFHQIKQETLEALF